MTTQVRKNVMDMFIDGARRGFTIATTNLLPNVGHGVRHYSGAENYRFTRLGWTHLPTDHGYCGDFPVKRPPCC